MTFLKYSLCVSDMFVISNVNLALDDKAMKFGRHVKQNDVMIN